MKLLVTGAAGFIGSHFVRLVLERAPEAQVTVLDGLRYSGRLATMADFADKVTFVEGLIEDPGLVKDLVCQGAFSHLVNFAAESHNDRSLLEGGRFVQTNTYGVYVLLEAARRAGIERVLHVSTDEVYGSLTTGQFSEDSPLQPNTPYSASKAGGDMLCRAHWATYQTPVIVTRGGNTYGPYHYPEKLIPFFLTRLLQGKKVPLYGEGLQIREWIHVRDHASGIWTALTQGRPGEVYNVGDDNELQNKSVVAMLLGSLGLDEGSVRNIPDPRKGAHDARYSMATAKLRSLGWKPQVPFEQGLESTVTWYRQNEAWWRPIVEEPQYKTFVKAFYGAALGEDL